jgi:CRISPR-associated protein Cmr1
VFQQDVLVPIAARPSDDLPLLAGAGLRFGPPTANAMEAWTTALHWLRDFRQMQPASGALGGHDARFARDRGDNRRPGRSNWPEADKVRQLSGARGSRTTWAHTPRHNDKPVWPRAGFGLPIVAQFQSMDRQTRTPYPPPGEPREFELRWRDADGKAHDRLASPLIVKAMALADGRFVPCALWLHRAYPSNGEIILDPKDSRSRGSEARFDELVAQGDEPQYACLGRPRSEVPGERLRNAFFDWLATYGAKVRTVAP